MVLGRRSTVGCVYYHEVLDIYSVPIHTLCCISLHIGALSEVHRAYAVCGTATAPMMSRTSRSGRARSTWDSPTTYALYAQTTRRLSLRGRPPRIGASTCWELAPPGRLTAWASQCTLSGLGPEPSDVTCRISRQPAAAAPQTPRSTAHLAPNTHF